MIDNNITKIANQASLKILDNNRTVDISHKFRWNDKSIWGVLFFAGGGGFLVVVSFIKTSDLTSKLLGIMIGLSLFALSLLIIIRQISDKVKITENSISFRHNLKWTTIPLSEEMKIKMKTEVIKIRRVGTIGSDFIVVTHYLQDLNNEITILKFQMDNLHKEDATKLGTEITNIISAKIRQSNFRNTY